MGCPLGRAFRDAKCHSPRPAVGSYCRRDAGVLSPSEALSAVFAAWERGDADAIADLFADDGVLAAALAANVASRIALLLVGGVATDRFGSRQIVILGDALRALAVGPMRL